MPDKEWNVNPPPSVLASPSSLARRRPSQDLTLYSCASRAHALDSSTTSYLFLFSALFHHLGWDPSTTSPSSPPTLFPPCHRGIERMNSTGQTKSGTPSFLPLCPPLLPIPGVRQSSRVSSGEVRRLRLARATDPGIGEPDERLPLLLPRLVLLWSWSFTRA
jgi:hypothetical protein